MAKQLAVHTKIDFCLAAGMADIFLIIMCSYLACIVDGCMVTVLILLPLVASHAFAVSL